MSVVVTPPKSLSFPEFQPLVVAAMESSQGDSPNKFFSANDLMASAVVVCAGLDLDSYGERNTRGGSCSAGKRMFVFTCNRLVRDGIFSKNDKGCYGPPSLLLTESATAVVDTTVEKTATPNEEQTQESTPLVATSAIAATQKGGVSWFPESYSFSMEEPYGGDVYLSRVAAEQTPCFSGWSPDHTACKGCSLASKCFKASLSSFAEIGRTLAEKDKAALAPPPAEKPPVSQPVPQAEPKEIPGSRFASLPLDTVCTSCSKVIKAGTRARSLPGFGVFHVECEVKK